MEDHEEILETLNNLERLKRRRTTFWEKAKRYREEAQRVEAEISDTDERCHSLETEIKSKRDNVFQKLKTFIYLALKLSSKDEVDSFYNSTCARYLNELRMDTITSADEAAAAQEASFAVVEEASAAAAAIEEASVAAVEEASAAAAAIEEASVAAVEEASVAAVEEASAATAAIEEAFMSVTVDEDRESVAAAVEEAFTVVAVDEERESVAAAVDKERESVAEEEVDIERSQERIRLLTANRKYWIEQRDSFLEHLKSVGAPYEDYIAELSIPETGDHEKDEDEEDEEDEGSPSTNIQRSQERLRLLNIRKKTALEKRDVVLGLTPVASSSSYSASPSVSSVSTINSRTQNSGLEEPPKKRGPGRPKKSV